MGSIKIVYDAEGDILDIDFRLTGEIPKRGIELHDNVTLWTDADQTTPVRLMLLSYSHLVEQPALCFDNLKHLPLSSTAQRAEPADPSTAHAPADMPGRESLSFSGH